MKQKPRSSFVKKSIMRESHFEVNPTVIQITIREMYKWKEARLKNIPTACPNQLYLGQNDKSKMFLNSSFTLSTISKLNTLMVLQIYTSDIVLAICIVIWEHYPDIFCSQYYFSLSREARSSMLCQPVAKWKPFAWLTTRWWDATFSK